MSKRPLPDRIVEQFSYRGERADVWRAFDRFVDTDAYLNLGYSPWYLPHVVGSSQRRLARVVGDGLADRLGSTEGRPLLDVGCGRGGPSTLLAVDFGFDVVGVDLVRYNVAIARENATEETTTRGDVPVAFVLGDASRLPVATDTVDAATAIDALVYVPDQSAAFDELARVVRSGGVVAISDLLARNGLDEAAKESLDAFADAWDMPAPVPAASYLDDLAAAGLVVDEVRELGPHSVDRFRKWTRLYRWLAGPGGGTLDRLLAAWDLDAEAVTRQVLAAHEALPHLRHVLVYARVE